MTFLKKNNKTIDVLRFLNWTTYLRTYIKKIHIHKYIYIYLEKKSTRRSVPAWCHTHTHTLELEWAAKLGTLWITTHIQIHARGRKKLQNDKKYVVCWLVFSKIGERAQLRSEDKIEDHTHTLCSTPLTKSRKKM